ncbi:2'-5' RNA ligase family protein [Amycolatopsis sp. PS_44_ISF1]|uniref:2'-5' RNA ligase family protein n=1 Tax=Amycolatopsis sp. PS_44_ISF1 TaxID=2974917 RepID=UPI0028DE4B74|nr:2'-5' RNA ligase family protein [Amycolatopsis sp. PS_44_ISF1]MDT8915315.1 2'-5' RNA ligase family protein [Amycolatopsis sp. PS_44_ISF1]
MPVPGTSALVVELPAAEGLLDAARTVNPALVRPGLPPHVTALYPFLPAAQLTPEVDAAVAALAAEHRAVDVRLTELVVSAGFVAAAAPALQPLADAVGGRWPDVAPYGGRFGPQPPAHLTVAMGATEAETRAVATAAAELLPVTGRAGALRLVVLTESGWQLRLTAPLGNSSGATHSRRR